jgi:hypothetical protein
MSAREHHIDSSALLTSPAFLLAVILLVLNDWVLKPALGDALTGKLSDVAGLFAFPLLWTALRPARRDAAFALTAVGFVLWKSPASTLPLAAWNTLGVWPLARVVDYSDWVAVVALMPSYRLALRYSSRTSIQRPLLLQRARAVATGVLAFVAFAATSVAPPRYDLRDTSAYLIPASKTEVCQGFHSLGFDALSRPAGKACFGTSDADTLQIYIRNPPERQVQVTVEASKVAPSEVQLRLLSVSAFGPEPARESLQRAFQRQVYEPLRAWVAEHRAPGS